MFIADLHIHSKYSRASAKNCDLENLDLWAKRKGIGLIGTGDFTHPAWRAEMAEKLTPTGDGLYALKPAYRLDDFFKAETQPRFVVSGEISCIYKKDGKTRKVHNVILLPSLEDAEELAARLEAIGNVRSDGRPILGLNSRDLLAMTLDACPDAIFIPAHIWTPHFSMFGAFSGFDTVEQCFGDLTGCVRAVETGLSSDPPMNRRVRLLDGYTLVSNSDAHSPAKLGRECNMLDCALSYPALKRAVETGEGLSGTIEFFPEEGKYHLDGHRGCRLRATPEETRAYGGKCPICGKKLTIGVLNRVEQLAVRPEGFVPADAKAFEHLMPLPEVIGAALGLGAEAGRTQALYRRLLCSLGSEMRVLREASLDDIGREGGDFLAEGVRRLRSGEVTRLGGYDGEYGTISLFSPEERDALRGQLSFLSGLPQNKGVAPPPRSSAECAAEMPVAAVDNPEQEAAIAIDAPAVAVTAGPGTGKTRTLVERAARLIGEGVDPARMAAVTFTNRAAAELKERLVRRFPSAERMTVGTFHAICLELLGRPTVADRAETTALAAEVIREYGLKTSAVKFLREVSAAKNGLETALPAAAISAYDDRLRASGALDFDDLLIRAAARDDTGRFEHLMVDEFQDVNELQYRLLRMWGVNLFAIGDPDQSIYGFRGAAGAFGRLSADCPELVAVRLKKNYRSTPQIVSLGTRVISEGSGEKRVLEAVRPAGAKARLVTAESDLSEAIFVAKEIGRMTGGLDMVETAGARKSELRAFTDVAVLCRTHRQTAILEKCLLTEGIPTVVCGREDYLDDGAVRGTLGFFRSLLSPDDRLSLTAALTLLWDIPAEAAARYASGASERWEEPLFAPYEALKEKYLARPRSERPRKLLEAFGRDAGIRSPAYAKLIGAAALCHTLPELLTALSGGEGDVRRVSSERAAGAVRLMTLHAAKGLEFPAVFVCGVSEGVLPLDGADPEEERRLFYVGITRARDELVVTAPAPLSPFAAGLTGVVREKASKKKKPAFRQISYF